MSEERTGPGPGEADDLDLNDPEHEGEDQEQDYDLGIGEPEEPEPETETVAEPPPRRRGSETIRTLRSQNRELADRLKRLEDAAIARGTASPMQQPDPMLQAQRDREETERVAQMPYEEQARYWARKSEERVQQQIIRGSLETRDLLDRQSFQQIMRERRLPGRYSTEVENLLVQARQNGMNPSREWLLNAVIGQEVLAKKEREGERERIRGQRRVASQQVRPGTGRSTAAGGAGRRREADDDEALLNSGVTLGEALRGA